jgi:acyl carrier protein
MNVKTAVIAEFAQVSQEQGKTLAELRDDTMLLESGLDSLCFAIVVARLEDRFGVDPFQVAEDDHFPVTFGDFVKLYEHVAA